MSPIVRGYCCLGTLDFFGRMSRNLSLCGFMFVLSSRLERHISIDLGELLSSTPVLLWPMLLAVKYSRDFCFEWT